MNSALTRTLSMESTPENEQGNEDQDTAAAIRESLREGNIEQFEQYRNSTQVQQNRNSARLSRQYNPNPHNSRASNAVDRNLQLSNYGGGGGHGGVESANPRYSPSGTPAGRRRSTTGVSRLAEQRIISDEELAQRLNDELNAPPRQSVRIDANTGLPIANTMSLYEEQQALLRQKTFSGAYFGSGKEVKPYFSYAMIFICSLLMAIEILVNNSREGRPFEEFSVNPLFGPSLDTLLFLGAKRTDLIVNEGDFWRLIMPIFLHGGILHLFFNMLFLYSFGTGLESEFGHTKVAYIYMMSGFFGILCSAIFNPTIPSVGASGACYGLIGAAWADFGLNFGYYKKTHWKTWLFQLTFGTLLNVALGLIPTLDNFAHLGGLTAGLFTGLSVLTLPRYDYFEQVKPDKIYQVILKTAGIFIVPLAIVIGLIVLYVQVDVDAYCPWCEYLSCVPTKFWKCSVQCEEGFRIEFINTPGPDQGSAVIDCPRDLGQRTVPADQVPPLEGDDAAQLAFCREFCLNDQ